MASGTDTWSVGADIGGTFTDVVALSSGGTLQRAKVLTTHGRFTDGVGFGLERCLDGDTLARVRRVVHGTTVATNAILEGRREPVGLITTAGFRDVLELRRSRRPSLYALDWLPPAPLVRREHRLEVAERVAADGTVVQDLEQSEVDRCIEFLGREGIRTIAVCLLGAHANPAHERMIVRRVRELLPGVKVTASSSIAPQIKEFERTSTTVVNAFLLPVVEDYVTQLAAKLRQLAVDAPLEIMQSDGTTALADLSAERPFLMIESGPAAGAIAAARLAQELERRSVVAFDMGGTTAKATLIEDYRVGVSGEIEVGDSMTRGSGLIRGTGYPVLSPCLDLSEVGSGGGSIAWVDAGGVLRVGPQSTGSDPGPACYGLGGAEPTVADAHVVLGYLNPVAIAGGTRKIHKDLALAAVARVADRLGATNSEIAYAIYSIANAQMRRAIRAVSVERGRDPRDFSLVSFGGAGGIHAATLARELEMAEVIVPIAPGLFSGLGLLMSDVAVTQTVSYRVPLSPETMPGIERKLAELAAEVAGAVGVQQRVADTIDVTCTVDVRYVGQSSPLRLPLDPGGPGRRADDLETRFHERHRQVFGHAAPSEPVEAVSLRVRASAPRTHPSFAEMHAASDVIHSDSGARSREAFFGPEYGVVRTPVISRTELGEQPTPGPLLIEDQDTTVVVPPSFGASLERTGSIIVRMLGAESD